MVIDATYISHVRLDNVDHGRRSQAVRRAMLYVVSYLHLLGSGGRSIGLVSLVGRDTRRARDVDGVGSGGDLPWPG